MQQGRDTDRQEATHERRRRTAAALALGAVAVPAVASAEPHAIADQGLRQAAAAAPPGEVLVRFASGTPAATRAEARRRAGARFAQRLPVAAIELVRAEQGTSAATAAERLDAQPGVLYAEPNRYRGAFRTANDPYFGSLWGLHNTGQAVNGRTGTPDADVDAPEAWDIATGDPSVTVAVVDSGVARSHPDLAPNMWANPGETGAGRQSNRLDDDGNGYVDDAAGWDWADSDADPSDLNGHGTHVAGTIGAAADNGVGVAGVAWRTRVMPLRALDAAGNGTVADAIAAYAYAGAKGARVLNASFGGPSLSHAEFDAIRAMPQVLLVAAAGNDSADNDSHSQYPCNYDLPNVVCVASSTQQDTLSSFSNYGARTVDLAAPGSTIRSTWLTGYAYLSGTSMAAPHVSGVAALSFAYRPQGSVQSVRDALLAGVDVRPGLAGTSVTGGRLNAFATLAAVGATAAPAPPPPAAPPAAAPDRTPPRVELRVRSRQRLRTLLRRGIRVTVGCSEACTLRARALIRRRPERLSGLIAASLTVAGQESARLSTFGRRVLVIKLRASAKRRLARARRATVVINVRARDAAGNSRAAKRRIHVRGSR
jgi:large repetitive protein